jgi:hypothetical protein
MVFRAHSTKKAMTLHLIVHLAIRHSWYAVGISVLPTGPRDITLLGTNFRASTGVILVDVGPNVGLRSGTAPVLVTDGASSQDELSSLGGLTYLRRREAV